MLRSSGESAPPTPGVQKSVRFERHRSRPERSRWPASDGQATIPRGGWMEPGEGTARGHVQDTGAEPAPPTAVLRFRHSPGGSGVSRTGHLRPGGRLVVEYDPARLPPSADTPGTSWDIICHVRFRPGGQHYSGSVLDKREGLAQAATPRHAPFEMRIPTDAGEVELWFESRGPTGTSGWDSRYGQNYSFVVIGEGLPVPAPSVVPRADAIKDPAKIRVLEDAAAKEETLMGTAGRRLHSTLGIHALVADPTGLGLMLGQTSTSSTRLVS